VHTELLIRSASATRVRGRSLLPHQMLCRVVNKGSGGLQTTELGSGPRIKISAVSDHYIHIRSISSVQNWPSEVLNQTGERTPWSKQVGGVAHKVSLGYCRAMARACAHLQSCSRPPSASRRAHSVGDLGIVAIFPRSASSSIRGRPTRWRNFDPSNLLAMSFRYQASNVSGFATAANSS
jgi:hypothetical protein